MCVCVCACAQPKPTIRPWPTQVLMAQNGAIVPLVKLLQPGDPMVQVELCAQGFPRAPSTPPKP